MNQHAASFQLLRAWVSDSETIRSDGGNLRLLPDMKIERRSRNCVNHPA